MNLSNKQFTKQQFVTEDASQYDVRVGKKERPNRTHTISNDVGNQDLRRSNNWHLYNQ